MKLTKDQNEALKKIKAFLDDPERREITISGIGGAGKSFLTKEAIKGITNVAAAAVSHSAKSVLQENLGDQASCYTIASLLGLRIETNMDGSISFVPKKRHFDSIIPVEQADLLIIDECSMIDEELYNMINTFKRPATKVIYLGDVYQLAPVTEDKQNRDSITFDFTEHYLNKSIRYTGPIYDLGLRIRSEIDKCFAEERASQHVINEWMYEMSEDGRTSRVNEDGSGYIFLNDPYKMLEIALEGFKDNDPKSMRIIAYKNQTLRDINSVVREHLFEEEIEEGETLPQFIPGELVSCVGGFDKGSIYNNQNFIVTGYEKTTKKVTRNMEVELPCLSLDLEPKPTLQNENKVYVVDENDNEEYLEIKERLHGNAKRDGKQWPHFHSFQNEFANFKYTYSQTSHSSQGMTYTDVVVFEDDILSVKPIDVKAKLQALYVACTRAKRRVYIYNKKYGVNQDELPEWLREELNL